MSEMPSQTLPFLVQIPSPLSYYKVTRVLLHSSKLGHLLFSLQGSVPLSHFSISKLKAN